MDEMVWYKNEELFYLKEIDNFAFMRMMGVGHYPNVDKPIFYKETIDRF